MKIRWTAGARGVTRRDSNGLRLGGPWVIVGPRQHGLTQDDVWDYRENDAPRSEFARQARRNLPKHIFKTREAAQTAAEQLTATFNNPTNSAGGWVFEACVWPRKARP